MKKMLINFRNCHFVKQRLAVSTFAINRTTKKVNGSDHDILLFCTFLNKQNILIMIFKNRVNNVQPCAVSNQHCLYVIPRESTMFQSPIQNHSNLQ